MYSQLYKKAVLYARKSSDEKNGSIAAQIDAIQHYAKVRHIEIVGTYSDDGYSGKDFDRPGWQALVKELKKVQPDYILVDEYSRFARNVGESFSVMEMLEKKYHLVILSTSEMYDLDPKSIAFFNIRAQRIINATSALEEMRYRVKRGIVAKLRDGRVPYGAGFGYVNVTDENGEPAIIPHETKAAIVREMFEKYLNGSSFFELNKFLRANGGNKSKSASRRILENKIYISVLNVPKFGDRPATTVKGRHQAIVDESLFYRVQQKLREIGKHPKTVLCEELPLRAIAKHGNCDKKITGGMVTGRGGKKYPQYMCLPCSENISATVANAKFVEILKALSFRADEVDYLREMAQAELDREMEQRGITGKQLAIEIKEMQAKVHSVEDKFVAGEIVKKTYDRLYSTYSNQLESKEIEYKALQSNKDEVQKTFIENIDKLTNLAHIYEIADIETKRMLVNLMFGGSLEIMKIGKNVAYRTAHILPVFEDNMLNINHLITFENAECVTEIFSYSISTQDGT